MAGSIEENRATAIKLIKRMKVCRGIDPELITENFQWWSPGSGYFNALQLTAMIGTLDAIMPRMPEMTIDATTAEVPGRVRRIGVDKRRAMAIAPRLKWVDVTWEGSRE